MLYRQFGKTGETVSALGFGIMRMPIIDNQTEKIDYELSTEMVRTAIDGGLTYIDTAYPYHGKASEPFVAHVLKDGYREKVKVATKLPSWLVKTREDMDTFLNEQLKNLETEYIDFYLIHAVNKDFWKNLTSLGLFDFLDQIKADGRVKHVGFSFHDELPLFKEVIDAYDWDFTQVQINYVDTEYQQGIEGLEYAAAKGLGIVVMEPLRGGKLVHSVPTEVQEAFDSADTKRTPVDWAMRWLLDREDVHVILSGMSTMDHVTENMRIMGESAVGCMTAQDHDIMATARKAFNDRIQVDCTACAYCMPCPHGVQIPRNFTLYNEYHLFDGEGHKNWQKKSYNEMKVDEKASACVACGACETHCPQNITIIDDLKKVATLLGE